MGLHEPVFLESSGGKGLVIFIHGFMGSPHQFELLAASACRQGYSTLSLLLPGHSCKPRDFGSCTAEIWQDYVDAEIERHSQRYESILLVGHSMGGLLALNSAVRFNDLIHGVFIIASPFKLSILTSQGSRARMRFILSRKTDPIKSACLDLISVSLSPSLPLYILKPFIELKKLMRETKSILREVLVPVTAVYSHSDELSSVKSLEILKAGLSAAPFTQLLLSESLHAYFPGNEQELLEQALVEWLEVSGTELASAADYRLERSKAE